MPNSVRAPHILDLLRRVAREPEDAALPLTADTAGQQQSSSSSSSSSGKLLLLAVDKPYTLQELLDKAVIFFEHSMRSHHRRAVAGAAGDAQSNSQGGFGVESETCRMLLTLDLDFDLHIDPASRDFRDAHAKRALVRSVAEAAAVSVRRVRVSRAMRGSVVIEAAIRPDSSGSDYRGREDVADRVAKCIRNKATPLCTRFRAKSVELVRYDDSWWRTAQRLAQPLTAANSGANSGANGGAAFQRRARRGGAHAARTMRVYFGNSRTSKGEVAASGAGSTRLPEEQGVYFGAFPLQGSLEDAEAVRSFQRQLKRDLADKWVDQFLLSSQILLSDVLRQLLIASETARFQIGWPQPNGPLRPPPSRSDAATGPRVAQQEKEKENAPQGSQGGVFCDVDIVGGGENEKPRGKGGKGGGKGGEVDLDRALADAALPAAVAEQLQELREATPARVRDALLDMSLSGELQRVVQSKSSVVEFVSSIQAAPTSAGHARYCQELFDHFRHPRTGKLLHGCGRFSYQMLEAELIALSDRLSRLKDNASTLVRIPPPHSSPPYLETEAPQVLGRLPLHGSNGAQAGGGLGLAGVSGVIGLAPPPPPGIAPVEIPLKIPAEILEISEFLDEEEKEATYIEPPLEPHPAFEPPEPAPHPPLALKRKPPPPHPPRITPYSWKPVCTDPLDIQPPLLLPDPEFVAPELEAVPVFRDPPMHSLPAFPDSIQWDIQLHRTLGKRPIFLLDMSGSMRDCDFLCAECAAKGRSTRCSWVSKLQEAMLVLLRDGGAASRCDAFDVIAFNFGALSMCGASGTEMWRLCSAGGSKGRGALAGGSDQSGSLEAAREFVKNVCASETWLGQWQSHLYDPSKERVAGAGVLHGASALGAPSGGFRRGRSNLTAALDIALGCRDSSDVYILSDGAVDDSVAGHDFLRQVASSSRGDFVEYTEPCGLPARMQKVESGQRLHAERVATLRQENEQAWAAAVAEYTTTKNAVRARNEALLLTARDEFVRVKTATETVNAERIALSERVRLRKIAEARIEYQRRCDLAEGEWQLDVRATALHNLRERDRYAYEVEKWERTYRETCEYDTELWQQKCAAIDRVNAEALDVAKALWESKCEKINFRNQKKMREAKNEYEALLAGVRERNQLFWESKLKHEATVKDINNENKRRVEKSESDYQEALQRFEEEVGGEEEAADIFAGKAEWRENKWAWREYIDIINTATITQQHLDRLKRRVFEDRVTVNSLALGNTSIDAQAVGAVAWSEHRPNPRERILGVRRELGRAIAEWVMAVEEVKAHNERAETAAILKQKSEVSAIRRGNARRLKAAQLLHKAKVAKVDKHNEGVAYVAPYLDSVSEDLTKVSLALQVLQESMLRAHAGSLRAHAGSLRAHAGMKGGAGLRKKGDKLSMTKGDGSEGWFPIEKSLVPASCLMALLQVAAGESLQSIKKMDAVRELNAYPETYSVDCCSSQKRRARSAPPGNRQYTDYLHWLPAADCHPVPSGVSSSALHGGGGGAPRHYGYTWENDKPLEGARQRFLPRTPNRRALDAQDYDKGHRYMLKQLKCKSPLSKKPKKKSTKEC